MTGRIVALSLLAWLGLAGCAEAPPVAPAAPSSAEKPAPAAGGAVLPPSAEVAAPKAGDEAMPVPGEAQAMAAVIDENSVFFARSQVEVDEAGQRKLLRHAQRLKDNPKLRVTLVGHTDDLGSRSYNLAIVDRRIDAVYRLLRAQGVPLKQLRRYGAGAERVSKACHSPECRRRMRRVELLYRK